MSYDIAYRLRNLASRLQGPIDEFGEQALFYGETVRYVPNALTR
jgi:phospholipid/cholesterol/gamma-HCH transport system permease protein